MFKPRYLAQAVALALILPGVSYAEFEISGEAKIEYSIFTDSGTVTGGDKSHDAGDAVKSEPSVKLFINSDVGEESAFHAELLLADDGEAASDRLEGGEEYSQYEILRELYFDTVGGGWDWRLGKQQVVWGTADGIKLLDIINPTDFRELNQNVTEDARIPIWMINAEKEFEGGNLQLIVSESRQNFLAGMDEEGATGAPFVFKGVDSITGAENGFLNVTPALANVAQSFNLAAQGGAFFPATGIPASMGLTPFTVLTVDGFASNPAVDVTTIPGAFLFQSSPGYDTDGLANEVPGSMILNNIAQNGLAPGDPNGNNQETNLLDTTGTGFTDVRWNPDQPVSAFEYMPNATFSTFNTFAGAKSVYIQDYENEGNFGGRWKATTDSGINYSLNFFNHMSANPQINMSWNDAETGEELTVNRCFATSPTNSLPNPANCVDVENIPTAITVDANGFATNAVTVIASNSAGEYYGPIDPTTGAANANTNGVELRMVETSDRVNSIGASFDMALDSMSVPVVIRGEFLYDAGEKQPVVDLLALSVGDLTNSLKMEDADYFKYVLGVDVTVLTNLLVSTQLIQFYNLDYIEEDKSCTTQTSAQSGLSLDCSRYTGDFSTLHLDNGLNKGDEIETFVSLFLSKPFGSDVQHRWNNITIIENDGGYWNRFDVEYSFNDEMVGTVELNSYWGDEDTTFGQFADSSNLQLGFKYLF